METTDQEKHIPRKPKQVTQAFYLILGSSAISLLLFIANTILFRQEYYSNQPVYAICWGLMYIIPFWIAFKINAGRNWARWVFAVFTVISLFDIFNLLRSFSDYPVQSILSGVSYSLVIVAMFLLFKSPSNAWFKYQAANETPYDPFITEKSQSSGTRQKTKKKSGGVANTVRENPILAGILGAMTPYTIVILFDLLFGLSPTTGEVVSYIILLSCLPAILLGAILAGLLSFLTKGSKEGNQVFFISYFAGFIGGLILVSLLALFAYLTDTPIF